MSSKLQRSSRRRTFRHNGCRRTCAVLCAGFVFVAVLAGRVSAEDAEPAEAPERDFVLSVVVPGKRPAGPLSRPGLIASWIEHAKRGIDDTVSVSVRRPEWREGSEVFLSPISSPRHGSVDSPAPSTAGLVHVGLCVRGSSRESIERGQTTAPTIGLGLQLSFH